MDFHISRHAEWEMVRRSIPYDLLQQVLIAPQQRLAQEDGTWIYQSRTSSEDGTIYLLRVVVAEEHMPPVVVTAYRTSKIEKYWRPE